MARTSRAASPSRLEAAPETTPTPRSTSPPLPRGPSRLDPHARPTPPGRACPVPRLRAAPGRKRHARRRRRAALGKKLGDANRPGTDVHPSRNPIPHPMLPGNELAAAEQARVRRPGAEGLGGASADARLADAGADTESPL